MTKEAHGTSIRMALGPRCGAPVTTGAAGGAFQCRYCQTTGTVAPRDDRPPNASPLSPDQESARLQRLRLQFEQGPLADPYDINAAVTDVVHLVKTPAAEFDMAWLDAWRRAVGLLQEEASALNQRRVYWLVVILGTNLAPWPPERVRAVIETGLDLLVDPGHRQVLRLMLFATALSAGDVASADAWLAGCDPAPAYLSLDTGYRAAFAKLSIARRDWQGVIQVLGWRPGDVPISLTSDVICGLLRAHALEELGYGDAAMEQFVAAIRLGPHWPGILEANASIRLCQKLRVRLPGNAS
jgi:hypothetical protein